MQLSAQTHRKALLLLGAIIAVAALFEPKLILYPLFGALGLVVAVAVFAGFYIYNSYHLAVQRTIDDTYRIPGTEVVLRAKFADWSIATAPYLEVRAGGQPPMKYCLAGPQLTRAQVYAVGEGRVLFETRRDTFLINTAPISVEGPRSWMYSSVKPNKHGHCDYDARRDALPSERVALKSGLKAEYVGAFDADGGYRRFWPASVSPEQKFVPSGRQ